MGKDDHDCGPYEVPDPSIYKVENCPKLVEVQEALRKQGLCDPWLRNEVWRYDPCIAGTHASRARSFFGRGFILGLGAFLATIAVETLFLKGHEEHGHEEHDQSDGKGGHN